MQNEVGKLRKSDRPREVGRTILRHYNIFLNMVFIFSYLLT